MRRYDSPEAFKRALEQRLRTGTDGAGLVRARQMLVFDRFLARTVEALGDAAVLKGGLVLELRLDRARTTRDVDFRLTGRPERVLPRLQAAGRLDLGDFLTFEVQRAAQATIQNDGMPYDGQRFRAECRLANRPFGQPFGVDVAFGDPIEGRPDRVTAGDVLQFAGIAPPRIPIYPVETHLAEKVHAYTMPRARPNTRVKDLPDMALLATVKQLTRARLRAALERTFRHRKSHPLPLELPLPSAAWAGPYAAMAKEDALPWATLEAVTGAAKAFLDPVLAAAGPGRWDPKRAQWR